MILHQNVSVVSEKGESNMNLQCELKNIYIFYNTLQEFSELAEMADNVKPISMTAGHFMQAREMLSVMFKAEILIVFILNGYNCKFSAILTGETTSLTVCCSSINRGNFTLKGKSVVSLASVHIPLMSL